MTLEAVNLSRRSFLGGALSFTALAVARPSLAIPVLWGDNIHDDTDGLQALIDSKPVKIENNAVRWDNLGRLIFSNGEFLVSKPIKFVGLRNVTIDKLALHLSEHFPAGGPFMSVVGCNGITLDGLRVTTHSWRNQPPAVEVKTANHEADFTVRVMALLQGSRVKQ